MKKRILSLCMALALCLTLLPTAALAAEEGGTDAESPITSVEVTVPQPVAAEKLATREELVKQFEDKSYTLDGISWYEGEVSHTDIATGKAPQELPDGTYAKAETVYTVQIILKLNSGNGGDVKEVTFNGAAFGSPDSAYDDCVELVKTFDETSTLPAISGKIEYPLGWPTGNKAKAQTGLTTMVVVYSDSQWSCAWYRGDKNGENGVKISGANAVDYTIQEADIGHTIWMEVTAVGCSGSLKSNTVTVLKNTYSGTAPVALAESDVDRDETNIFVKEAFREAHPGYQYAINTENTLPSSWTTLGVFQNLQPNMTYYLFTRVGETATTEASAAPASLQIKTEKQSIPDELFAQLATAVTPYIGIYDGQEHDAFAVGTLPDGWSVEYSSKADTTSFSTTMPKVKTVSDSGIYSVGFVHDDYRDMRTKEYAVAISPKEVTIEGVTIWEKTFNGYTSVEIESAGIVDGKCGNDDVYASKGTGYFNSEFVNKANTVTFTGFTLAGSDAANYKLKEQPAPLTNQKIQPKQLTFQYQPVVATEKIYDGTDTVAFSTYGSLDGFVSVSGSGYTMEYPASLDTSSCKATYDSAGVGTNKTITFSGFTLTGTYADNYTLSQPAAQTGTIRTKDITATGVTKTATLLKTGTDVFADPVIDGVNGETVSGTFAYSYGEVTDKQEITNALRNSAAGNYSVRFTFTPTDTNYTGTVSGTLTVQVRDIEFTVNGEPATAENVFTEKNLTYQGDAWLRDFFDIADVVAKVGDQVIEGSLSYNLTSDQAGEQTGTVYFNSNDGTYRDKVVAVKNFEIQPKSITNVSGVIAPDKVYDGWNRLDVDAVDCSKAVLEDVLDGDQVFVQMALAYAPSCQYSSKNAGEVTAYLILELIGADAKNYTLSTSTLSVPAKITPKDVTITGVTAVSKSYNGTTEALVSGTAVIDGVITGDDVSVVTGTATFNDKNVAPGKTVTFSGFSLTGSDAKNYELIGQPASTTADIVPKQLTVSTFLVNKIYDGTNKLTVTDVLLSGIETGDDVRAEVYDAVITGSDFNVGSKLFSFRLRLSGTNAANYLAPPRKSGTVEIKPATPTGEPKYTAITGSGKTLADAALAVNDGWPAGTVKWVDANGAELATDTEVTANTAYKWVFTPDDTDNYNTIDGTVTLWRRSSGGGGGSSSGTTTKTETTTNPDGSVTKTETKSDGTVTETTTYKDGSTVKTETKKDGSSITETKLANGSTGTVKIDKDGQTTAEAKISDKAVSDAKKADEAVKIPAEVTPGEDSKSAPTVKIDLPSNSGETKIEIPVKDATSGTVAIIVKPDGTEEIVKDSIPTKDGIQLTVDGDVTVKIVDNAKNFTDTKGHWAQDSIDFVSARGLVNGTSSTAFSPNAPTTRAQLWTILARQAGADLTGGANWYEKAQNWAKANGISDGTNPNGTITRAQMVTMLWRAAGSPEVSVTTTFTDVPDDSYYAKAVAWAVEHGITTGVGSGKFDPNGTCTRAQIATFLYRLYLSR